jgi:hypothetical protein
MTVEIAALFLLASAALASMPVQAKAAPLTYAVIRTSDRSFAANIALLTATSLRSFYHSEIESMQKTGSPLFVRCSSDKPRDRIRAHR